VSVVFDFNASLNNAAPVSPMSLPVCYEEKRKRVIADGCLLCAFFLLSSLSRLSLVSVVLDFSDSLNDAAPVSPISLSINVKWKEKSDLSLDFFCVSSFLCLHNSDQVQ
jgi:hypothetical protein